MVPLTWAEGDFFAHARARYPVLADHEFEILRGVRGSRFEEVPVLTAMNLRGPNPVKSLVVKLWIRPLEPIVHMPMDTPTVSIISIKKKFNRFSGHFLEKQIGRADFFIFYFFKIK